ncbi:MAG: hypothetical protein FD145_388 [Candidatus Saganbacteria bacterium]|uniref:Uncharacterized protein n=1 Tax=Candidatus Saganbacteria bacterium TaxID=2575572 RepID=A0A833L1X5_UNCSA|nr:MAG: hypothetical protein FD145_388 [Candidatus Saganbacteria bacterium]
MPEEKKPVLSGRSAKGEIFKAYKELLDIIKEQKYKSPQEEKKENEKKEIIKTVAQISQEKIVNNISSLKLELSRSLDTLGENLSLEYEKLSEFQQAIEIEKNNLNNIHQIEVEAESLSALLQAQSEKKAAFEADIQENKLKFEEEMDQLKKQWEKDQEEYELLQKEKDIQSKKDRKREEDEYNYNLQLQRKKEKDNYEEAKEALEKELQEKEKAFAAKEEEYNLLKTKAENFPKEMDKAIKEAEKTLMDKLSLQYKHESALLDRELEGERKLAKQTIFNLELKISEQAEQIRQLSQKLSDTNKQMQDMALKALEGASINQQRIFSGEKNKE